MNSCRDISQKWQTKCRQIKNQTLSKDTATITSVHSTFSWYSTFSPTVYWYFWAHPFLLFSFSFFHFLVVGSMSQIKLTYVSFWVQVKTSSHIVSYSMLRCENTPIRKNGDSQPNLSSRIEPTLPANTVLYRKHHSKNCTVKTTPNKLLFSLLNHGTSQCTLTTDVLLETKCKHSINTVLNLRLFLSQLLCVTQTHIQYSTHIKIYAYLGICKWQF